MTESNQGPATPGTAARCEVCGREEWRAERPYPAEGGAPCCGFNDPEHWRLGYECLKAENASLLESLREARDTSEWESQVAMLEANVAHFRATTAAAEEQRDGLLRDLIRTRTAYAAAEQRAEAAEKDADHWRAIAAKFGREADAAEQRNTELEGALVRLLETQTWSFSDEQAAAIDHACDNVLGRRVWPAALHDEERNAPPRQYSPEYELALKEAVRQKEEEERKLAAMTPAERDRYIEAWAARLAPQLVEDGCAIDRALNSGRAEPPAGPSEAVSETIPEGPLQSRDETIPETKSAAQGEEK